MSDSNSQQQQTSNYTDNRAVLGQGALYANNGAKVTVTSTDGGAVKDALTFAGNNDSRVLDFATNASDSAFSLAASGLGKVLDQVSQTQQLVASAYADAQGQTGAAKNLIYAALAAVALVAVIALKGKG